MAVPISSIGTFRWLFRAIQSLHKRQLFFIDWICLLQFSSTLNSGLKWWWLWRSISFSRLGWRSRSLSLLLSLSSSLTGFLLTGVGYLMLIVLWLMVLEMVFMLRTRSPFSPPITCGCNVFSVCSWFFIDWCTYWYLNAGSFCSWFWLSSFLRNLIKFMFQFMMKNWVLKANCIYLLGDFTGLKITAQSTVFWFVTLYYECSC